MLFFSSFQALWRLSQCFFLQLLKILSYYLKNISWALVFVFSFMQLLLQNTLDWFIVLNYSSYCIDLFLMFWICPDLCLLENQLNLQQHHILFLSFSDLLSLSGRYPPGGMFLSSCVLGFISVALWLDPGGGPTAVSDCRWEGVVLGLQRRSFN